MQKIEPIVYIDCSINTRKGFKAFDTSLLNKEHFFVLLYPDADIRSLFEYLDALFIESGDTYTVSKSEDKAHWDMTLPESLLPQVKDFSNSIYQSAYLPLKSVWQDKPDIYKRAYFFELLFRNTPANIYIKDRKSNFIRVNSEWYGYVGIDPDTDLTGKSDFDIFDYEHAKSAYDDEQEIMRTGIPKIGYEEKETLSNGKVSYCLSTKMPFTGPNGRIEGITGISYDISEQKKAQMRLEEINKELIRANEQLDIALVRAKKSKELEEKNKELIEKEVKIKEAHDTISFKNKLLETLNGKLKSSNGQLTEQNEILEQTLEELKSTQSQLIQAEKQASVGMLASGIAHEINNPLNFIAGSIKALEKYLSKTKNIEAETIQPLLEAANQGINRTATIVKSLNRFNHKSDSLTEDCNMQTITDNCLVMLESRLKHKVNITTEYDPTSNIVVGNEGELHQVVLNLIMNAEQSISDHGHISIKGTQQTPHYTLQITDTGHGIKAEDLEKVTRPFYTTKKANEGTGLGMSISQSIIQKHKGRLHYDSQWGKGTIVTLTLPTQTPS